MIRLGGASSHTILFGHLVHKEALNKFIRIEHPYQIQKIDLIEVFNMAVVCLYNQSNPTNNKVRLLNFKTGQEICEEKTCHGIPQVVEYISQLDLLLIGQ